MIRKSVYALSTVALATMLAACGGGGGDDAPATTPTNPTTPTTPTTPSAAGFIESAKWTFTLPASGTSVCYDFNAKAEVADCSGTAWDLKMVAGARSATLWTNSGTSGSGNGGAFGGPFDHTWADLQAWKNGTTDPVSGALPATVFFKDAVSGVFTSSNSITSAAFEYGVNGSTDHLLYPNFRTFLITTNSGAADPVGSGSSPVFALQVTGYYGGAGGTTSGHPSFRWVDRADPGQVVRTATVNASADWVYYDLVAGAVSSASGTWHIAFNRYNVKLNGGQSGSGTVAGFLGKTPAGFYDGSGNPIASKFTDSSNFVTLAADLIAPDLATPASATGWKKDTNASTLNPTYQGTFGATPLNYGWYSYYSTLPLATAAGLGAAHMLKANPENATMLRGGEGNTYARFHVTNIAYANPTDYNSAQTWTIEFDVQPAQ